MKLNRKKINNLILSIAISLVVILILLPEVNLSEVGKVLANTKLGLLFLGLFSYILMIVMRAKRFQIFFKDEIRFRYLIKIAAAQRFFNEFLPLRGGDFVYLYLVRKSKMAGTRNLSSLIIVRLMDFVSVIVLALVALLFLLERGEILPEAQQYVWYLLLIMLVGILSFLLFIYYLHPFINFLFRLFRGISRIQTRLRWIENKGEELTLLLRKIWTREFAWQIFSWSVLVWLLNIAAYFMASQALGLDISLMMTAFIVMLPTMLNLLPVRGAANLGTFEAAISLGLVSLGLPLEIAVTASFALHILLWLYTLAVGIFGHFIKPSKAAIS